jgi:hypothetical protein
MAQPRKKVPTSRLNLEMAESVRQKLENLQKKTEADSLTEVVRRALTVYDSLWREKLQGGTLVVKSPGGYEGELVLM